MLIVNSEFCSCLWEEVVHSLQGVLERGCTQGYVSLSWSSSSSAFVAEFILIMVICYFHDHLTWLLYLFGSSISFFTYINTVTSFRLNTDLRVLNEYQQIQSFSAFNSIFNNSGLFGIYASTVRLT